MISKCIAVLVIFLYSCCKNVQGNLSPQVQNLCDEYWEWRMKDMPQFATFVGIHTYNALLDDMSEKAYLDRYEISQRFITKINGIEPSLTEEEDILNLKVLKYELLTYIDSYYLKGYYLPLNYQEGPHIDMKNLFNWMLRKSYDDYDVMIQRMEKIHLQIDQIIELMKAGVENGITYHEISMKNLDKNIGNFVVDDPTLSPLYSFFKDGFPSTISQEQISKLQSKAQQIIKDKVKPAFQKLRGYVLNEYVTRKDIAVTTINRGYEFYKRLIWFHTTTDLTAEDIQNIGFNEVERIEKEMQKIIVEMGYAKKSIQEFSNMIRDDPKNYYNNSDDLLKGFNHIVNELIPPHLPEIFKNLPKAQLKIVANPSSDGTVAYYYSGAYDGSRPGVFYVNTYDPTTQPKYELLTLSLHEGNPGHHLQGSHSIESPEFPYFRRVMEDRNYGFAPSRVPMYSYYLEGWALYAEGLGFDMKLYEDPLDRYGHYSYEIFRACRLVVDTGMHALGWTRDKAVEYMFNHTATAKGNIENEIDRYITWPGQALAYKMGQLTISKLREKAQKELGDRFDLKDFHEVVLNSFGPMNIVEDEVQKWINKIRNLSKGN